MIASKPPSRRFRVSIGELIGLVALAALGCVCPGLIPTEIVAAFYWLTTRHGTELDSERRVSLGVVLAAVYLSPLVIFMLLPLFIPITIESRLRGPFSLYFPIAPTLIPVYLVDRLVGLTRNLERILPGSSDNAQYVLGSIAMAAAISVLTLLACRSPDERKAVMVFGFFMSTFGTLFTFGVLTLPRDW
jgi:hypothetical protein